MPVTLWMLFRLLPDDPAFAFGLAASALWPGTIAGALFTLTGPALWACVIVSFLFGLVAILYGASKLPDGAVSSQKQEGKGAQDETDSPRYAGRADGAGVARGGHG